MATNGIFYVMIGTTYTVSLGFYKIPSMTY